jgi:hypothetical protein
MRKDKKRSREGAKKGLFYVLGRNSGRPVMVGGAVACPAAVLARLFCCQAARRLDSSSPSGAGEGGPGQFRNTSLLGMLGGKLSA